MKYASEIIGLPVIAFNSGEKFEKVKDVIYDDQTNTILAILTDNAGMFSSAKVIPFNQVKSIGDDAVVVPDKEVQISINDVPSIKDALENGVAVKGKTVMTEDGKDLGSISDLQIDEVSGRVIGYKTSGGIFHDAYKGQAVVPAPMTLKVGENVVFVPNSTAETMEHQVGGLKAAAQSAGSTIAGAYGTAKEKTAEVYDAAKVKAGELAETAKEKGGELAETAKEKGAELKEKAAGAYDGAKEKAGSDDTKDAISGMREKAAGLVGAVTGKASELKDGAADKLEQTRINDSLGRPADRVILDRSDEVILNAGDIITNEAVSKAKAAGMLSALLGAVGSGGAQTDGKVHAEQPEAGSSAAHL